MSVEPILTNDDLWNVLDYNKIQRKIMHGADVNAQIPGENSIVPSFRWWYPVHLTSAKGSTKSIAVLKLLIRHRADLSLRDGWGRTALDIATSPPMNSSVVRVLRNCDG